MQIHRHLDWEKIIFLNVVWCSSPWPEVKKSQLFPMKRRCLKMRRAIYRLKTSKIAGQTTKSHSLHDHDAHYWKCASCDNACCFFTFSRWWRQNLMGEPVALAYVRMSVCLDVCMSVCMCVCIHAYSRGNLPDFWQPRQTTQRENVRNKRNGQGTVKARLAPWKSWTS